MAVGEWKGKEKFTIKGPAKWLKRDNLIVLILCGVLLFIIALPTKEESGQQEISKAQKSSFLESNSDSYDMESAEAVNLQDNVPQNHIPAEYDYATYLEQKLKNVLKGVSGVGDVEVMVTLESSEELVVEKDAPVSRSNTNETDSEGGSRIISQIDTQETTIYRTEGNNSEPYVVKTILPKVEGVLVVAKGAGQAGVNKNITEIVQALFDVEAHKVKVTAMDADI